MWCDPLPCLPAVCHCVPHTTLPQDQDRTASHCVSPAEAQARGRCERLQAVYLLPGGRRYKALSVIRCFCCSTAWQGAFLMALLYSWLQIRKKWKENVRRPCPSSLSTLGVVHPWGVLVVELVDLALAEVSICFTEEGFSGLYGLGCLVLVWSTTSNFYFYIPSCSPISIPITLS